MKIHILKKRPVFIKETTSVLTYCGLYTTINETVTNALEATCTICLKFSKPVDATIVIE